MTGSFIHIEPASPASIQEALRLLAAADADARSQFDRLQQLLDEGSLDPRGLFVARQSRQIVGVALGQVAAGRVAVVWPPSFHSLQDAELAPELLAALLAWIDEHDVQLTQAVMDPADEKTPQWLAEAGFSELAELLYLVAPGDSLPQHAPSTPFQWLPAATLPQHEMTALVESTYVDTLDCPALNACRATEDVLDGYRATGSSGDRLWLIARHAGRDVGCLLLADHPQFHQFELVYMGLVPPYRGKGLGRAVVQMAKWIAQQLGRQQMVLAVDAKNEPARKVYQAEHFVPWQRRRVMVRYGVARSSKTGIHDA